MSDTPRTDALFSKMAQELERQSFGVPMQAPVEQLEELCQTLEKEAAHLRNLLAECHEFIERFVDVRDGDEGDGPRPNKAMSLCQLIEPYLPKETA